MVKNQNENNRWLISPTMQVVQIPLSRKNHNFYQEPGFPPSALFLCQPQSPTSLPGQILMFSKVGDWDYALINPNGFPGKVSCQLRIATISVRRVPGERRNPAELGWWEKGKQ
jgi:hypothetical protein